MQFIGAFEAKTHLSEILQKVLKGEQFFITKHGLPIAKIVPADENAANPESFVAQMKAFKSGKKSSQNEIKKMIGEGRRY